MSAIGRRNAAAETEHPTLAQPSATTVTLLRLEERGIAPNNPRLPVLIYSAAFPPEVEDLAARMEECFEANGWPPQWRDGIYDFHHYHSQGHEVLGIARGHAILELGGGEERSVEVTAGDVLLLPAGTGHRRRDAAPELLVVGAYPAGQSGDICRDEASLSLRERIARLPFPPSDPVSGRDGPLLQHWG